MIDLPQMEKLIAAGESLKVEFKSDRQQIGDGTIYEEVVALANTSGGTLLIGVEDDGAVTGAAPWAQHRPAQNPGGDLQQHRAEREHAYQHHPAPTGRGPRHRGGPVS